MPSKYDPHCQPNPRDPKKLAKQCDAQILNPAYDPCYYAGYNAACYPQTYAAPQTDYVFIPYPYPYACDYTGQTGPIGPTAPCIQ